MTARKVPKMGSPACSRYHAAMNLNDEDAVRGITWFVSRHPGAIEWAKREGLAIERWVEHLDPTEVEAGDIVIGTLPVNLAADACKRGARYLHLSLEVPAEWRGRELSADDLQVLAAHLQRFRIEQMTPDFSSELA